jgi:hypothetical protein
MVPFFSGVYAVGVTRTNCIFFVTCGLLLAAIASPARSQSDEELSGQIWIDINPSYYFDPHNKLYGDVGVRKEFENDGWWRLVVRPSYRTKLPRRFFLSFGLGSFFTFNELIADRWELRPFQGVDFNWPRGKFPLRHYLRLEERFDFHTETWSSKISLRARYKLSASYRFATVQRDRFWQITAGAEAFVTIAGTQGQFQEQSRLMFGMDRSLKRDLHFRFELTWQRESIVFGDDDDTASTLYFRFRFMKSWGESQGLRKETSS